MIRSLISLISLLILIGSAVMAATITNPYNIIVSTGTGVPPQTPGPSAALYANNPYYTCASNRYVATNGTASNSGLDAAHPWDIFTAAGTALPAGTCINLARGIYAVDEVDMQHGGTNASKTGYIVWRCTTMPFSFSNGILQGEGNGCVIRTISTAFYSIRFQQNVDYIMFDGFEFDGTVMGANSTVCLDIENGSNFQPINHHVWVFNSDFHGCGQSGIQFNFADWLFVIHNVWHDNASQNCVMGSGLSMWQPMGLANYSPTSGNGDYWHSATTNLTYHIVIAFNVGYHNFNPQGACGATANTDGEGIILDTWRHVDPCPNPAGNSICPYPFATLVMGNVMYNNGGNGIEVFNGGTGASARPITIVNNTTYANNWDTFNAGTFRAGGLVQDSSGVRSFNNIMVATRGAGILANNSPFLGWHVSDPCPEGNTWDHNLSAPTGENNFDNACNTYPVPTNIDIASAGFANQSSANPNFSLATGSAAKGAGQLFDLWPHSGANSDIGACDASLTSCP